MNKWKCRYPSQPKLYDFDRNLDPAVSGIHDFKGTLTHSAHWDNNINWEGKRVAVIGSGASAIQLMPELAKGTSSGMHEKILNSNRVRKQKSGRVCEKPHRSEEHTSELQSQ